MARRRRITRYNERIGPDLTPGMMTLTVFLAVAVILSVYFAFNAEPQKPADDTYVNTWSASDTNSPETSKPKYETTTVSVDNDEVDTGYLVLVNGEHECTFAEDGKIVLLYGNEDKGESYGLATASIACRSDVLDDLNRMLDAYMAATEDGGSIINSGYRTLEDQTQILNDRIESDGEEEAYKYVALPGRSEHHTGLAFDIAAQQDRTWLPQYCREYGFIQRYRADKEELTGIAYEYWHYRYVGDPHAEIMMTKNLCLEEYISLIWDHPFSDPYEFDTEGGERYIIYYVPCGDGEKTEIQVPAGMEYDISGDNVGGFIVTVDMGKTPETGDVTSEAD